MKGLVKIMNQKKWTDLLDQDVYNRLANCKSKKSDILPLAQAKWGFLKNKPGFQKEDALIAVLELLDCNSCYIDLTAEDYNNILFQII